MTKHYCQLRRSGQSLSFSVEEVFVEKVGEEICTCMVDIIISTTILKH